LIGRFCRHCLKQVLLACCLKMSPWSLRNSKSQGTMLAEGYGVWIVICKKSWMNRLLSSVVGIGRSQVLQLNLGVKRLKTLLNENLAF